MFHQCKVSVVKRGVNKDLADTHIRYPDKLAVCNRVEDGQTYIVTNPYEMPEGICAWAWADIRHFILAVATGSTSEFMKDEYTTLATCTDPLRPVVFKIERMDQPSLKEN